MAKQSYTKIRERILSLVSNKTKETPEVHVKLIEDIQLEHDKYLKALTDEEKEEHLNNILYDFEKYDEYSEILENMELAAVKETPQYTLDYLADDEEYDVIEGENGAKFKPMVERASVEEMLERVNIESALRQHSNPVHQIFRDTIGWWMDNNDVIVKLRELSIRFAKSEYLDQLAYQFGLTRKKDETDDDLRKRIMLHLQELYKVSNLRNSNVKFFSRTPSNPYTCMTSRNTFLTNRYFCYADDETENYWYNNYITWRDIIWL